MAKIVGIFEVLVLMNLRLTCVLVESLLAKSSAGAPIFTCLQNGVCACPDLGPAPSVSAAAVEAAEEGDDAYLRSPFFITVVGKQRLRRLYRRGGCGVSVLEVQESEPGESTVSEAEEADDSGSASDGED